MMYIYTLCVRIFKHVYSIDKQNRFIFCSDFDEIICVYIYTYNMMYNTQTYSWCVRIFIHIVYFVHIVFHQNKK